MNDSMHVCEIKSGQHDGAPHDGAQPAQRNSLHTVRILKLINLIIQIDQFIGRS